MEATAPTRRRGLVACRRARSASALAACALVLLLPHAARAAAAPPKPGPDGVTVTSLNTALAGVGSYPSLSIAHLIILGNPKLKGLMDKPGAQMTGFVADDDAIKAQLKLLGRWGGITMQNQTMLVQLFDYMNVPGKAWSTRELAAAAPMQLKTRGGEPLSITKDPSAPGGIRVNGFKLRLHDQSSSDRKSIVHSLDGLPVPPSLQPQVDAWIADAAKTRAAGPKESDAVNESGPKPSSGAAEGAAAGAVPTAGHKAAAASGAACPATGSVTSAAVAAAAAALLAAALV